MFDPAIFRGYDVRGRYPEQFDAATAYQVALAYAAKFQPQKVAVAQDVRPASAEVKAAIIRGLTESGVAVTDIGTTPTDVLYFTVGHYGFDGGMIASASHNPPGYAGIKLTLANAEPLFADNGLLDIRDTIAAGPLASPGQQGSITVQDVTADYLDFILSFVDVAKLKPTKIVANANFGANGGLLSKLNEKLGGLLTIVPLNYDPDGTFPKGRPDPMIIANRQELVTLTKSEQADFGVAWDGDGDRCFFCDNQGVFYEPCYPTALFAERLLATHPGATIIYDVRYARAITAAVTEHGGTAMMGRVGHSYIKDQMRRQRALFCGESSGHYYFADNWYADNGMIPFLLMWEALSETAQSLSEILAPYTGRFFVSGEQNVTVADTPAVFGRLKVKYADAQINELDGVTIEYPDWRVNVRTSNTEPLVRCNVEGTSAVIVAEKKAEVMKLVVGE
ncbi:MAG: phosphomannomutase/phosphoglucomutase [Patescibacteria group bacterium]